MRATLELTFAMVFDRPLLALGAFFWPALAWAAVACSSSPKAIATPPDASADVLPHGREDAHGSSDATDGGVPSLRELDVAWASPPDGAPEIALVPAFSPSVHDYYVRCAAGTNKLRVTLKASPGATSLVTEPSASPSEPQQTLSVDVNENQAIVAAATDGVATTEYWLRCLPHDFPNIAMELHPEAGTPPPGYYLVGNRQLVGEQAGYAMVVDLHGVPVWYYKQLPGAAVRDVDHVVPGSISFAPSPGSSAPVPFEVRALMPPATTYLGPLDTMVDLHELQPLPNGDYLVFAGSVVTGVDLTGLTTTLPDGGSEALGPDAAIVSCNIVEFEPTSGKVVWQWVGMDHIDPAKESTVPEYDGTGPGDAVLVDVFHCNSIDVDPKTGNLLASFRNLDAVLYIDRTTGSILWKMGGRPYSKDNATFVPVSDPFYRQHDARFQSWTETCAGGSGQVSMFDDQSLEPGPARGVVYDVAVRLADAGASDGGESDAGAADCGVSGGGPSKATVAWQSQGLTSSASEGSFRISSDGSRVIGWGDLLTPNLVFTEVDEKGRDLADFYFMDGDTSYRVIKVEASALDLSVLRNTAGLP